MYPKFTEWSQASNTNVCYLTYAYVKNPTGFFTIFTISGEMIKSHRLQYAAKVARDLVLDVRHHCVEIGTNDCWIPMSQITVLGFSFGAYIASQICNDLYKVTREKVGKLIGESVIHSFNYPIHIVNQCYSIMAGIDPAGIALTLWKYDRRFIGQGDAKYVQIIHTDTLLFGTMYQTGDCDIYVEDLPVGLLQRHAFAVYLHMATSMKKLLLIAEKDGNGKMIRMDDNRKWQNIVPNRNQVFIGVYSEAEYSKRGQIFHFSMQDRFEILRDSIAHVVRIKSQ